MCEEEENCHANRSISEKKTQVGLLLFDEHLVSIAAYAATGFFSFFYKNNALIVFSVLKEIFGARALIGFSPLVNCN